jgi:anti-anti-sigma factor
MGPTITIDHVAVDGSVVIALSGELDIATASCCARQLREAVAGATERTQVVIDLSGLGHFSAAGVAVMIRFARHCAAHGFGPSVVTEPDTIQSRIVHLFEEDITLACTHPASIPSLTG